MSRLVNRIGWVFIGSLVLFCCFLVVAPTTLISSKERKMIARQREFKRRYDLITVQNGWHYRFGKGWYHILCRKRIVPSSNSLPDKVAMKKDFIFLQK